MKGATLALIAIVLAAAAAFGDQWRDVDIESLIESAPGEDVYPDAAAVFLNIQEMTEVAEDGSLVTTRNRLTRILTLRGRERYSNESFLYDTDRTILKLIRGATVRKSGRVVEVEEDGINDVTPAFLEGATTYANVLEKVISFPVAGPGSVMDSQVREETVPSKDGSFSGIEYMGTTDPILAAEFTLRYPESADPPTSAVFAGLLGEVEVGRSSGPGELIVRVEDVPALVEEEFMPPAATLYPRLLYSSYGDWSGPAAFFAGEFFPHVQTDGEIALQVSEVTAGLSSDEDRLRALYLDVATNVRNVFLNLGVGGYEPNDASTVLSNRHGDTRDKAVLLVSALRSAGIEAYPAAVRAARGPFVEEVPTLKQFDRLLIALPDAAGYRFLDPMLDDVAYGFLRWGRGNTALVVKDDGSGELVEIPSFDPDENSSARTMSVVVEADGSATVRAECQLRGFFDRKARRTLKDATPSEREKVFEGTANAVSAGAADLGHTHSDLADLTVPVTASQDIQAPDLAIPQGDMMIVRMPAFPFGFASTGIYPSLAERRYPFEMPCEARSSLTIDVTVPDGYEVVRMPDALSLTSDAADFGIACEWNEAARIISWTQDVTFKRMTVSVGEYRRFKDDYDALASPKNKLVLLKKTASG
jgi:hypothetical protein